MRSAVEPMWNRTTACSSDTSIDGNTRYQCPRIIAVDVPPSSAAEVTKLAAVRTAGSPPAPAAATPCATRAAPPESTAVHTHRGRSRASTRPMVAQ